MSKKLLELKKWASENITLINLLPTNTGLKVTTRLIDVLEDEVDEKYYLSEEKTKKLTLDINVQMDNEKSTVPILTPDRLNKRQNGRRFKEDGEPMFTLTSQDRHGIAVREATKQIAQTLQAGEVNQGVVIPKEEYGRFGKQAIETLNDNKDVINDGMTVNAYNKTLDDSGLSPTLTTRPEGFKTAILPITNGLRIRKLTPLECWRLQGFTDEQFYKAQNDGVSNSQLYKQAGNSVSVPVVDAIVKCL